MKSQEQKEVGNGRRSAHDRLPLLGGTAIWIALTLVLFAGAVTHAQSLYKYQGPDGEWIYTDRPPADGAAVETRVLARGAAQTGVAVEHRFEGGSARLTAHNRFYAPVEMVLEFKAIRGVAPPLAATELRWTVAARSELALLDLGVLEDGTTPFLDYRVHYRIGDPKAKHRPPVAYRAPFAISTNYAVTQAYPEVATHTTPDSYHAVDFAMPIGTNIFAAREGVVFDVASKHFRNGLDRERDGPNANVVRILHDDGTYAIYAHLNTNSIRVQPGDRVRRGQYIADSGNTGYSSGPHLHFAVVRNIGMEIESLPVIFAGQNEATVLPTYGSILTAY